VIGYSVFHHRGAGARTLKARPLGEIQLYIGLKVRLLYTNTDPWGEQGSFLLTRPHCVGM
jgi:hypothetical protein